MQSKLCLKALRLPVIWPLLTLQLPPSLLLPLGTPLPPPPSMSPSHTSATQSDFHFPKVSQLSIYFFGGGRPHGMWDLVPRPGIEPTPRAVEAWSLNHWTTREVPPSFFLTGPFHSLYPLCRTWAHHTPPARSNSSLAFGAQLALPQPLTPMFRAGSQGPSAFLTTALSIRGCGCLHIRLSPADCEPVKMGACGCGSPLQPSTQHPAPCIHLVVCIGCLWNEQVGVRGSWPWIRSTGFLIKLTVVFL